MIHVFQQQKDSRQIHNPTHLFTTQTCKSWSYKVLSLLAYNQAPSRSAKKKSPLAPGFVALTVHPLDYVWLKNWTFFDRIKWVLFQKGFVYFFDSWGTQYVLCSFLYMSHICFLWVLLSKWATESAFPSRWGANEQLDGGWVLANCWFFRNTLTLSNLCSIWRWNLVGPFFTPRKWLMGGKTCIKRLRHADGYSDLGASQYVWYVYQCSCRKYSNLTYASSTTNYIQLLYQVSTIFYVFTYP